jgi:RNA polymerase sigma-70 factor (ECF subfamily)
MNVTEQSAQAFEQHRDLLFAIAYRMLGSAVEAEDIVQEAFLRWLQASNQEVQTPKAYLTTIVVRLCINQSESARVQREVYVGSWLPEPILTSRGTEMDERVMLDETLSFAFLVMMEQLGPLERAVFLLREVFEYDYTEIAAIVDKGEANCRQIFHRAHQRLENQRQPRFKASREQQTLMTEQFLRASINGDMQGLLDLLTEDIVFIGDGGGKAPIALKPVHGRDRVSRGTTGGLRFFAEMQTRLAEVNGQPALVGYLNGQACGIMICEVEGELIHRIYAVVNPDKLHWLNEQTA